MSGDDPVVREALERFQPAPAGRGADWDDVRRRAATPGRRGRVRRLAGWGIAAVGVAAIAALFAALIVVGPGAPEDPPAVGDPAPPVTFPVVYPDPTYGIVAPSTSLASLRGQVVVLSFIDTTCPDCGEAADLLGAARMTPASALIVVSGEPEARARSFATGPITVTAPSATPTPPTSSGGGGPTRATTAYRGIATAADSDGALGAAFGIEHHPTIVVIDRHGRIARRYEEPPAPQELQAYLATLAAQAAPADLPSAPPSEPHLSLFDDPTTVWSGRPSSLMPRSLSCPHVPGSLRLAAEGPDGEALLVGQGLGGSLITISHYGGTLGGSVGCGAPRTEAERLRSLRQTEARGYALLESGASRSRYVFAMLLLDGYDTITIDGVAHRVPHNGFIGSFPRKPGTVVISGPAGERRVRLP